MDECFDFLAATQDKLAREGTGKLKAMGPSHGCVCVCVRHLRSPWASADALGVDDGKEAANLEQNQSLRGTGV